MYYAAGQIYFAFLKQKKKRFWLEKIKKNGTKLKILRLSAENSSVGCIDKTYIPHYI